jgi:hypothetical protein
MEQAAGGSDGTSSLIVSYSDFAASHVGILRNSTNHRHSQTHQPSRLVRVDYRWPTRIKRSASSAPSWPIPNAIGERLVARAATNIICSLATCGLNQRTTLPSGSFNHSDISALDSTSCERSGADYRTRRVLRLLMSRDTTPICFSWIHA